MRQAPRAPVAIDTAGDPPFRQKRLGRRGLVVFLAALSAFPALSTDLYLPALPEMTEQLGVPEYQTNLTLILFFVFYACAMLVWGPLSDRYGRRPVLLAGLGCYTLAGVLCAVSPNVYQLIASRVLQAIGAGAASAVSTAIVKDVYQGRRREVILAVIQSMIVVSPMVAPMIGALVLRLTSWRGAFVAQAVIGLLMLAGTVVFEETLQAKLSGSLLSSLKRLGVVLQNRTFTSMLVNFSLLSMAALAFISSSSYIYQVTFGVSSQVYSLFFAVYAAGLAIGPQLYVWLSRRLERTTIITGCFVICAASGLLVLTAGRLGPWPFILALFPTPTAFSCMRPPAIYLLLEQHEADAGSASSLVSSTRVVLGSIGMVIVSLELWGRVELIGALILGIGLVSLGLWLLVTRPLVLRATAAEVD